MGRGCHLPQGRVLAVRRARGYEPSRPHGWLEGELNPFDKLCSDCGILGKEIREEAEKETGESDALVVMQGAIKNVPLIAAVFAPWTLAPVSDGLDAMALGSGLRA